jgi:polyisoprenoid-binding protein YceI
MNPVTIFKRTLLAGMLFINAFSIAAAAVVGSHAASGETCSLFKHGKIEKSILSTLLNAAKDGHMYRVQTATSQIRFCVDSKIQNVEGSFKEIKGGIALNQQQANSDQAVIVIKTDSLETDSSMVKKVIKSPSFFDVKNHPEILFVSTGVEWRSPTRAVLKGDLTLRGVTKPVVFNVELHGVKGKTSVNGDDILVTATTSIRRSDFGMDGLPGMVNDSVKLCMSVKAKKYQA